MTDQPNVGGEGAGVNQTPVSNQPIEGEAERLSKLFDAKLSEALKPVLAEVRGVQSRQDKDRKGFQEVLDEFKKLKAKGLSDEEAESAMLEGRKASEKDDLLFKMAQKLGVLESPSTQVPGKDVSGADATDKAIEKLQLNPNDAGVLKIRQDISDPTDRLISLAIYKASLGQSRPDASTAPSLQSAPSRPANEEAIESKSAELIDLQREPTKNAKRIAVLRKELGFDKT